VNRIIQPAPVRRSVDVAVPQSRAFEVFTGSIGRWWPMKSHHIGAAEPETVVIEPRAGGRWYERAPDGAECEVGKVLAFEPPGRLLLGWQLTSEFKYDPDFLTEVEILFIAQGPSATRVELEHRHLERYAERAEHVRQMIDAPNGWPSILSQYAQFAAQ
jgi:uncharacterized protein YndB with AHSA1/START domain